MNQKLIRYLEFLKNKGDIHLTEQFAYSPERLNELLEYSKDMLYSFERIRHNLVETKNYVLERANYLEPYNCGGDVYMVLLWLLEVTDKDDSYVCAYNSLLERAIHYSLVRADYKYLPDIKLMELLEKEKLTNASKSFPEFLLPQKKNELAEICTTIFNNGSKKFYAIMLCLLSENNFINIPNKKRSTFYESWYNFINEELPKRKNFEAINRFIQNKAVNGFIFKDEDDDDYRNLKTQFESLIIATDITL
jgi:hypothetical protein